MTACDRGASGDIELYFYGELDAVARAGVEQHLRSCADCRRSLDDLGIIRAALASRPTVDAPPAGDWSEFMRRLDGAVELEQRLERGQRLERVRHDARDNQPPVAPMTARPIATYVALAALLALVTSSVAYVARSPRPAIAPAGASVQSAPRVISPDSGAPATTTTTAVSATSPAGQSADAAFTALSEQHFERSKLVVLGLANKDAHIAIESDWAYERGLASTLLSDTRLYRQAAEQRGLRNLAGVMGDLEIVLLQTSLTDEPDATSLAQIQRLIQKRDLVLKMEDATAGS